jgi:hypothetical protein
MKKLSTIMVIILMLSSLYKTFYPTLVIQQVNTTLEGCAASVPCGQYTSTIGQTWATYGVLLSSSGIIAVSLFSYARSKIQK